VKRSDIKYFLLVSAVLLLISGCQRPDVASVADSSLEPMDEGFCVDYKRGLLYGDFMHNAPREIIWSRASVVVRPSLETNSVDVEVVSDCSLEKTIPVRFRNDVSLIGGGQGSAGDWEIMDDGTGREIQVLTPDRVRLKYSLVGSGLRAFQLPGVAPRSGVIFLHSVRRDEDVFVFIDVGRDVAYRVDFPIKEAISREIGETFSLRGHPIDLTRIN